MSSAAMDHVNGGATSSSSSQPQNQNGQREDPGGFKLKFCTVCASNQNR